MVELANDRVLRALLSLPVDKTPIWIMRQAGRYLPEYRKVRQQAGSFMKLCKTPELACEVTLQPLARFDLDAAIIFSDILTIPDAMGLELSIVEGKGPVFANTVRDEAAVNKLFVPDPETELKYVCDAIRLCRQELNNKVPLIGFSGSPWTIATYMVEGGTSKHFSTIKSMLYRSPELLHRLLDILTQSVTAYLNAQIAAGAQAIMIFDTWGSVLTAEYFRIFSLAYIQTIIENLTKMAEKRRVPVVVFIKGGGRWMEWIADCGCDAIGLDWTVQIAKAKRMVGERVALQGNLDPAVLYAEPEVIRQEAEKILESYGEGPGHVFNLGHGILPDVPPENVKVLVDAVHELSENYHQQDEDDDEETLEE